MRRWCAGAICFLDARRRHQRRREYRSYGDTAAACKSTSWQTWLLAFVIVRNNMEMSVFAERNAIGFSSIIVTISLIFTIAIDGSQCHHRHRYLNWCASLASRVLPLLLFLWQHDCFFGNMAASLATWLPLWLHGEARMPPLFSVLLLRTLSQCGGVQWCSKGTPRCSKGTPRGSECTQRVLDWCSEGELHLTLTTSYSYLTYILP